MSFLNLAWRVIASVTFVVVGPAAVGQTYHPFADPMEFDPDWQFFAPVDVESLAEISPRKRSNIGWFATYDRSFLWTSRAEVEQSKAMGDYGWGNRFDIGLMTENDSGWLFSFRKTGGPNVYDRIYQERIDRVNPADTGDVTAPVVPFLDANDPQLGTRAYILGDSLNVLGMSSFEINKTWRRKPYRFGGVLEPMIGLKYSSLKDYALNQTYTRGLTQISTPGGAPTATTQLETLVSHETTIKNQMFGGQLGARYFTHYNRWTLSGEMRAFGMANFQSRNYYQKTYATEYGGGPAIGVATVATDFTTGTALVSASNTEFTFGFEARAEAAYLLTRSFNIRAGIDLLDFADGIWRGANPGFGDVNVHDQDVQMVGFTFGATLNR